MSVLTCGDKFFCVNCGEVELTTKGRCECGNEEVIAIDKMPPLTVAEETGIEKELGK